MPSMHDRIREDLLIKERALWTALTSADPGPAIEKLAHQEVNMIFPQTPILTLEGENKIHDAVKPPFHRFDTYSLDEVRVIIIDLMAGTVTYRVTATRGNKTYRANGSTTWQQASDGEWRIICHQETMV